ncbi:type II secretion system protein G [Acinetobacter venetianus RAG-1 = CIP 110063]|uniref:Type II secretion system core protein G n=1 Tax=Acinetobacter venetianus (strain ATCC 31012 / DSM 23050 / BCRC 14357 / CCUG 45561 / CIP 110063 / KCTC 2702 / LMG 19082 / RAG-1) TaxID=1191460 RepID=N8YPV9_ACIVR|nr:type II secretion system major pseudopilin GspG [Acinetobacter venetianus]ENV38756.1 type II secretion system protein G [Acinetobacter venetianus RAG-1 = CIP 110063]
MFEMKMKNSIHEQHAENNFNPATRSIASRLAVSCHSKHSFSSCVDDPRTHNTVARLATRSSNTRFSRVSGFTLIEVMVVIVILGVLAALIVPNVMGRGEKAKVDTTSITLKGVAGALDQYKLDNGRYPSMQDGGLDALVNQPASAKNWLPGGYVKGGYPKDSWENDLQYVIPGRDGRSFDLYSFGADGKEGGEGNDADIYYQP